MTQATAQGRDQGTDQGGGTAGAPTPDPREVPEVHDPERVLVVGGDSGIGRAVAVALAAPGRHVALTYSSDEAGGRATGEEVEAAGATAHVRHLDLATPTDGAAVVEELADAMGGIDALVLCSGTGSSQLVLDLPFEQWREVLTIDLDGFFCCLQAAARRMVASGRGGRVVAITSVHEHAPRVGAAAYCAAKGGLGLLVRTAALELAEHGITVNAVAPGEIATPMTGQTDDAPTRDARRPGIPVARPGDAREVAAVVELLCSARAAYVTGASWVVDGGMLNMGPMAGSHLTQDDWRRP
ncbi:SDR family oxidoreductase [Cellulomonas endophytica]|uniref:SDR family oxidoreductase n=1 Tax=Cellulomonas endophytica TaxID=2494735 RepID=UPI0010124E37|nr:SDR family oxidoreductase [Cellulomonas endophytica]